LNSNQIPFKEKQVRFSNSGFDLDNSHLVKSFKSVFADNMIVKSIQKVFGVKLTLNEVLRQNMRGIIALPKYIHEFNPRFFIQKDDDVNYSVTCKELIMSLF